MDNNLEIKVLLKAGAALIAVLATLAGIFSWLGHEFVRHDVYTMHEREVKQTIEDKNEAVMREITKLAQLIKDIEVDRERDTNELVKLVKGASAYAIIVRRNYLLSKGESNLTQAEKEELTLLNQVLADLNFSPSVDSLVD